MKSQLEIIKEKLLKDGNISNIWAFRHYILRLGARIHDLRQDGWNIEGSYTIKNNKKTKIYEYYI